MSAHLGLSLEPSSLLQVLKQKLGDLRRLFIKTLSRECELRVWCVDDYTGNTWWSAYDPTTEQAIYQVSETEIRTWVEQRHHLATRESANCYCQQ